MSPTAPNGIVLFSYPSSPFGKRVEWYLQLRKIEYALCEQPVTMPRPDLEKLGIHYRRIPILTIGRDVYLDTRLILRKLEEKFPSGRLGSDQPEQRFVERLLEKYMVEGPVFQECAGLVPAAFLRDPKFAKDRKGFLGRSWTPEDLDRGRPESLVFVRNLFDLLETTILADGRTWILGTEQPSLADIQAIWPFDWVTRLRLPPDVVSAKQFPRVCDWISRFRAVVDEAASSGPKAKPMTGDEAVRWIRNMEESSTVDAQGVVDETDPQGFTAGAHVEIYASDWGSEYRDSGRLVGLGGDEVKIVSQGTVGLRVHAPRTGFKVGVIGKGRKDGKDGQDGQDGQDGWKENTKL